MHVNALKTILDKNSISKSRVMSDKQITLFSSCSV